MLKLEEKTTKNVQQRQSLPVVEEFVGVVVKYWTVAVVGWLEVFEFVMLNKLGICCDCVCCLDETCWRSCWLTNWF